MQAAQKTDTKAPADESAGGIAAGYVEDAFKARTQLEAFSAAC